MRKVGIPNRTLASPSFSSVETLYFCCLISNLCWPKSRTSQTRLSMSQPSSSPDSGKVAVRLGEKSLQVGTSEVESQECSAQKC